MPFPLYLCKSRLARRGRGRRCASLVQPRKADAPLMTCGEILRPQPLYRATELPAPISGNFVFFSSICRRSSRAKLNRRRKQVIGEAHEFETRCPSRILLNFGREAAGWDGAGWGGAGGAGRGGAGRGRGGAGGAGGGGGGGGRSEREGAMKPTASLLLLLAAAAAATAAHHDALGALRRRGPWPVAAVGGRCARGGLLSAAQGRRCSSSCLTLRAPVLVAHRHWAFALAHASRAAHLDLVH
ncbi:Protein of unknown function [Gryllus bimaculatus]|nr:Protein of unknown function [Gryllus bimaculatus]